MGRYKPEVWREHLEEERLKKKYGENWRIVKRFQKKVQEDKPVKKRNPGF